MRIKHSPTTKLPPSGDGELLPSLSSLKPPAWLKDAMVDGGVDVCLKIDDINNKQTAFSLLFEAL